MKVLGLVTEFESGAAAVEDGRLLAAVNEERLCRIKLAVGFPRGSIATTLSLAGWEVGDLDYVLVAGKYDLFVDELRPFEGWFEYRPGGLGRWLKRAVAGRLSRYRDALPFLEKGYYALLGPSFRHRRTQIRTILRDEFGVRCPIVFVDHHLCHATSAYFTSGLRDALVITLDGGGDGRSATVHEVRDGVFRLAAETSSYNSLGNYYAYATHISGFKAHRHEGKITGLAAHGEPKYLELLEGFIQESDGQFFNRGRVVFDEAIRELKRRLPAGWDRADLASSLQLHFERLSSRFVGHWAREIGMADVALAGGVAANVRVNQVIHERPEVDRVYVHPGMGDGGMGVGAAFAACVPGILDRPMRWEPEAMRDVFLGPDLADGEIREALERNGLSAEGGREPIEEAVADLLADGCVVARAEGRMEYGPRALGNRSILYQPTDPSVNDWLNRSLSRTEFMPFAPSVLYEERDRCFQGVDGAAHSAEFMTITFDCTPWMRERMPGVVHLDGTARPQLVRRDRSPGYHRIIEAFHERTGLPGIINTSFNMHEEPIVCSADDAVRAFLAARLDYLAIGPHLVRHPDPMERPHRSARATTAGMADADPDRGGT